ncbi:hypothetical protein MTO96_001109 [Rhipicephalus appendiculatus]
MESATTPNVLHFKGFNDVLEARPVEPVGEVLPVGMLACSLCSVVSSEHFCLSCKHTYCVTCFVGIVKRPTNTSLQCPRRRQVLPTAESPSEVHY